MVPRLLHRRTRFSPCVLFLILILIPTSMLPFSSTNSPDRPPESYGTVEGVLPPDSGFLQVSWQEFRTHEDVPCGNIFAPAGLHLCLNLAGTVQVGTPGQKIGNSTAFWVGGGRPLQAIRLARMQHHFVVLSMDPGWLVRLYRLDLAMIHPELGRFLQKEAPGQLLRCSSLQPGVLQIARLLDTAGPAGPGRPLWLQSQLLEILSIELFPEQATITVGRDKRTTRDVVARVCARLRADLEHPPTLAELAREVGRSPYHLSRMFSKEMGQTISQYLRGIRLDRAATLLRSGRFNVTETALEVGYSSLSHFSKAFAEHHSVNPYKFTAPETDSSARNSPQN